MFRGKLYSGYSRIFSEEVRHFEWLIFQRALIRMFCIDGLNLETENSGILKLLFYFK